MFTGLIEYKGRVKSIHLGEQSAKLTIEAGPLMTGTELGDSIATNGVCLTVSALKGQCFTADVMAETLKVSNLSSLHPGDHVNLERAMLPQRRFGGHMVTGHIDGVGVVAKIQQEGFATVITVSTSPKILKYVVQKGSVALDGISLTVVDVTETDFKVSVIPHTKNVTTLLDKRLGDSVNLEADVIGKYIEKLCHPKVEADAETEASRIEMRFLAENGFLDA